MEVLVYLLLHEAVMAWVGPSGRHGALTGVNPNKPLQCEANEWNESYG